MNASTPYPVLTAAMIIERMAAALRNLPDDAGMIEHNPDDGMRLFCCEGQVVQSMTGSDRAEHAASCWYVAARRVVAAYDADEAASRRIVACVNAFDGVPFEEIEGVRLTGPVREVWCSTDSCGEHWGWENVDEVPDWAPRDVSSVRTTFTAVPSIQPADPVGQAE